MKTIITSLFTFIFLGWQLSPSQAQGCVAVRSTGSACTGLTNFVQPNHGWQLNFAYRYFKSYKHFRGNHEEKNRVEAGSDVRNYTNNLDIGITKFLNQRWSIGINIPFQSTSRSSLYEHDGKTRHFTEATGLGDLRISAGAWLFKPSSKGNVQIALGIKLPTGDYNYMDFFYKNDSTELLGPVDQSIQLGDGGTGITTEVNAFYNLFSKLGIYGNFYYLFNPRDQNGTSTARGGTPNATAIKYKTATMSVADQYLIRGGINFTSRRFSAGAGVRAEGIPSADVFGASNGFRRPGYVISVEPSVNYQFNAFSVFASVPIALERNRVQSQSDIARSTPENVVIGDAAFADYSINIGLFYQFGGMQHSRDIKMDME
ncbi:MAG: hypothetical protein IPM48_08265 [Saprospiraceae bacterium]|nr:hypothetical protein [Saprospiraceae bacterium]